MNNIITNEEEIKQSNDINSDSKFLKGKTLLQILPSLYSGGVERGTVEIARAAVNAGMNSIVVSSGGKLVSQIENDGSKHITIDAESKNPFTIRSNSKELIEIIEEYNVDIVHARSRAPAWSAYKACQKTNAHFVTTFHGLHSLKGIGKRKYNSVMTFGEKVIAASQFISEHIQNEYDVPLEKISVIPRGVDMEYFDPENVSEDRIKALKSKWGITDNRPVIFLPGRITRWKGQDFLLDSLSRLTEAPSYHCIIAGDSFRHPKFHTELTQKILELNLGKFVKIVDSTDDMPAAYKLSNLVISASQKPEAFGRIAIEAQAMGKPVVVTNIGGSKETVIDGTTGRRVDPNFTKEMSEGILKGLMLSENQKHNIAITNRQHILDNFSLDQMCSKTLDLYKSILNNNAIG